MGAVLHLPVVRRPRTRLDCADVPRPCPYSACRHHLESDDDLGPFFIVPISCSLDVADGGPHTLDEVAPLLNLSRERVRQIEQAALEKLSRRLDGDMLAAWAHAEEHVPDVQPGDLVDAEFRALVQKAYERIVPKDEQGAKAIRVSRKVAR